MALRGGRPRPQDDEAPVKIVSRPEHPMGRHAASGMPTVMYGCGRSSPSTVGPAPVVRSRRPRAWRHTRRGVRRVPRSRQRSPSSPAFRGGRNRRPRGEPVDRCPRRPGAASGRSVPGRGRGLPVPAPTSTRPRSRRTRLEAPETTKSRLIFIIRQDCADLPSGSLENGPHTWSYGDSNPRPPPCHGGALPTAP